MTMADGGSPLSTARAMASSDSAARSSPRCGEPSAATSGTGSPTRSTKPRNTRPVSLRLGLVNSGFCDGTPTSEGRLAHSVSTDRRLTGWPPGRAATRLIVPIDNPSKSLIGTSLRRPSAAVLTIVADCPDARKKPPNAG